MTATPRVWLVRAAREVDTSDGFTAPTGEIVAVFASFDSAEDYVGNHSGTLLEDPDGHEVKP